VDRKVRRRALVLLAAAAVLLVLVVRELVRGNVGLVGASAAIAGGLVVGVLASRIHRFDWDDAAHQVAGRVDRIGLAVLVALILASLSLDWVLGHWATGATLTALTLSASAGTLAGRALGTRRRVRDAAHGHTDPAPEPEAAGCPRRAGSAWWAGPTWSPPNPRPSRRD
jgi:hypothetical protein